MRSKFCGVLAAAVLFACPVLAVDWAPIDQQTLSIDKPRIDPEADAEALFWEAWVADQQQGSMPQTIKTHYLRVKIFTEKGVEDHSTIDLASVNKTRILDLRGRTIKPDGRIVELEKASVFERTVAKVGNISVRKRSFSMPNVEVGDIIEYQWREFTDNSFAQYIRLHFQRGIPVWRITYHVKPSALAARAGLIMQSHSVRADNSPFESEGRGFYRTSVENAPAFKEEAYMPPEDQVRAWSLLYYSKPSKTDPERFWKDYGKKQYGAYQREMKADGTVKAKAAELTADAANDAEKTQLILDYCVGEIRRKYHDRGGFSSEEQDDFKANRGPGDTIKKGVGTGFDVNMLFGALASAAGLEVRVARVPRRDDLFFDPNFLNPYFLNSSVMAVQIDGEWRFYDPQSPYVEPGMLSWPEEGVQVLVTDPKNPQWAETAFSEPERSVMNRSAVMELSPNGTLEGEVVYTYTGSMGSARKRTYDGQTDEERIETIEGFVKRRLSTAEVSDVSIKNADSVDGDISYSFHVKVPGYAAATGKRLFLQPNFFERNTGSRFDTNERIHDIYFNYGWSENDSITIKMPEGFTLEDAEAPQSSTIEHVGGNQLSLAVQGGDKLVYQRDFVWGQGGNLLFPASSYSQVKGAFDFMHQQDQHAVTLRQVAEKASGGAE